MPQGGNCGAPSIGSGSNDLYACGETNPRKALDRLTADSHRKDRDYGPLTVKQVLSPAPAGIARATAAAYAREYARVVIADIEEKDFERIIAVDAKGVWLCMKYAIQHMKAHGGGVIFNTE